ncbi:MAG: ankyrin repeat domain-containing protein [Vulcanimicrobiota bacterium]
MKISAIMLLCIMTLCFAGISAAAADDTTRQLSEAAKVGDLDKVKSIIETNPALLKAKLNYTGVTALHTAARYGQKEVADYLIQQGADVNALDIDGETPLHKTAMMYTLLGQFENAYFTKDGQLEVAQMLVEKGADVNALSKKGETPLRKATMQQFFEMVKLLQSLGAK